MKYPAAKAGAVDSFCAYLEQHARGRDHAIFGKHLAVALGLGRNWDRKLRALANAANANGILVCTGDRGYFIAASFDEVEETIGRLESQALDMLKRIKTLRALAARQFSNTAALRRREQRAARLLSLGQLALIPDVGTESPCPS